MENTVRGKEATVEFLGLPYVASYPELIPRKSSETVVTAALDLVERIRREGQDGSSAAKSNSVRVLDLGTGCGCLLLSLLCRCSPGMKVSGVGVDLSEAALQFATRNTQARVADGSIDASQVGLVRADFSQLDQADVRQGLLAEAPFDIIISNPPFLAESRAKGRITHEGKKALV
mmetsp:Transcript_15890/g.44401  ORF Transcript_15890/g.44401 Transcript_15890/m.44401 type:complete len:175 (+) Transcript_15890:1371-1895(+)